MGQHFPNGYILVISGCSFYFNSCLQTREKKTKMPLIPPQVQSGALAVSIKAEQEKGAGDYCSPSRPGTVAGQIGTQGEEVVHFWYTNAQNYTTIAQSPYHLLAASGFVRFPCGDCTIFIRFLHGLRTALPRSVAGRKPAQEIAYCSYTI